MAATHKLKRATFFTLQLLLLAFAAVCMFYGQNDFAIRSVGLLAIFAALVLIRKTRRPSSVVPIPDRPAFSVKPWLWSVGLALLGAMAAAFVWLLHDAATGHRSGVAPIVTFILAGLFCSLWWGGLFMRWFMRRF